MAKQIQENIILQSMEEVMHNSMMPYAEYVILERALPRVEDGLKPVQRRILYTMLELGLSPEKPHRKSARIVGDTLGKYHPHGDTSVYDAMVRMAQDFNMRYPLVNGHGNFGSIDGDSAAAMRYTEARLSPISLELLQNIEKETVNFNLNFDDTLKEPETLPAQLPNLLLNGATGIAVGLATNIPPHNLTEVVNAAIWRIKHPNCDLNDIMQFIQAPDFPLGGELVISDEIYKAYETGKGRLTLRAKTHIEKLPNNKQLIVITELPYQVNKASMLEKILQITEQKREMFSGISDIRDESDRNGIRACIELKSGVDAEKILTYLYKYSDLQINFGVNMVAIANGQPKTLNLIQILDHYISYQKKIVTLRLQFDLAQANKREHILSGLMIAVKNIDTVIRIIRSSKNTAEAKVRLIETFSLTQIQAQAILDMRLARLTELEIESLEHEYAQILALIAKLTAILESERLLFKLIISEHEELIKKFGDERRTQLVQGETQIVIDKNEFTVIEDCVVGILSDGTIKRVNLKTYLKAIESEEDIFTKSVQTKTDKKLLMFTSLGTLYSLPIETLPDSKWKDKGVAMNSLFSGIPKEETIINIFDSSDFSGELLFVTKKGMVKTTEFSEFDVKKLKIIACGLKEKDSLIYIDKLNQLENMIMVSKNGMAIVIPVSDIPTLGKNAKGVIGMRLSLDDDLIYLSQTNFANNLCVVTDRGYSKQTPLRQYEVQNRPGKGVRTINLLKSGANGTRLVFASVCSSDNKILVAQKDNSTTLIDVNNVPIQEKASKGSSMVDVLFDNIITGCLLK